MEKRASDTSRIVDFFDKLFDSVNGGTLYVQNGKDLRCAVSAKSDHTDFWKFAIKTLKNMYFQKNGSNEQFRPPSLKNWILTLEGFGEVWKTLQNYKIKFFLPRAFNQDPLENFFGQMWQHGGRNINPTCSAFKNYFKTLLVNNFVSSHSLGSNCEEQFTSGKYLTDLKTFLTQGVSDDINQENMEIEQQIIPEQSLNRSIDLSSIGYVSGFISKKVLKKFKCKFCRMHILSDKKTHKFHELVEAKEFHVYKRLFYCTPTFVDSITKCYNVTKFFIRNIANFGHKKIAAYICTYITKYVHFIFICQHKNEIIEFIVNNFVKLLIFNWTNGINRILSGRDCRNVEYVDPVYVEAKDMYLKKLKK